MKDSFVEEGFMTQKSREQRVRYKLDESMTLNQEEIKIYNVPFAGNTNTCKETFVKGERILEYCIEGDLTMEQLIGKPIFRDELVEYLYSISRQMVSMVHNGLKLGKIVFDRYDRCRRVYQKFYVSACLCTYTGDRMCKSDHRVSEWTQGIQCDPVQSVYPGVTGAEPVAGKYGENIIKDQRDCSKSCEDGD